MQPATSSGGDARPGSSALRRWGPIAAIVAVAAVAVGIVVATKGGDDGTTGSATTSLAPAATTSSPASSASETTTGDSGAATSAPPKAVTYPLSFDDAAAQGIDVSWDARCDQSTGRLAVPTFFAPACVAPFSGDNGGATAPGVTADAIKIVYYLGMQDDPIINYITEPIHVDDTNAQEADTMRGLVKYFEAFYETYGRKIDLQIVEGTGIASDEVAARADAVHIAEDIKPFMVWSGPALTDAFADELAARDILCLGCSPSGTAKWYADRAPTQWRISMGSEQAQTHLLEMIGKELVGKNAVHAGDQFVNSPRTFGLVYVESGSSSKELADAFAAGMDKLGAPLAEVIPYQLDPGTIQQTASQLIAKLKAAGVTSIIYSGDPIAPKDFTKEATAQGYFPEWILGNQALADVTAFARTYDQEQWKHAFGFSQIAVRQPREHAQYYELYKWFTGQDPPSVNNVPLIGPYPGVFYAALQLVGPNLTRDTWTAALAAMPATTRAVSQPSLNWGTDTVWGDTFDYAGVDDATMLWWDPTATGTDEVGKEGTGMYMWVDGGQRYIPGEWPTEDRFFVADGAVPEFATPPASEAVKDYPSPAG